MHTAQHGHRALETTSLALHCQSLSSWMLNPARLNFLLLNLAHCVTQAEMTAIRSSRNTGTVAAWLSGRALVSINGVTLRRARLILGWVTVYG